jgi:hypothetical protein
MLNKLIKHFQNHVVFYILIGLGIGLRLFFMVTQGLSHDELSAWNRLSYPSFNELLSKGVGDDMHPAFLQIVLWLWVKIAGDGEFLFRLPTLFFGVGGIAILYKIGCQFFSKSAGIIAVLGLSVFVFPIIHTTLARPYSSGFFFIMLLTFGILRLKNHVNKRQLLLTICTLLIGFLGSMYSHYYAFICAAWIAFVSLFYLPKQQLSVFVLTGVVALLLFVPHIELTTLHLSKGGLGWLGKPDLFWLFSFFKLYFNSSTGLLLLFFAMVLVLVYKKRSETNSNAFFALFLFFGLYVIGHLLSVFYTPILREPGQLFMIPFFFLGIGQLIRKHEGRVFSIGVIVFSVCISIHSVVNNQLGKPVHFEPFRETVDLIGEYDSKLGEENMLRLANVTNTNYYNYYARENAISLVFELDLIEEVDEIYELARLVSTTEKPYVMLARTNRQQNVIQYEIIRNRFPKVVQHNSFFNANFSVWEKGEFMERRFEKMYTKENQPDLFANWNEDTTNLEFIGALKIPLSLILSDSTYVLIKTEGWLSDSINQLPFVTVLERNGEMLRLEEAPVLYQAWDQLKLENQTGKREFYTALEIPHSAKDSDVLHVYFWNSTQQVVQFNKPIVYCVNPRR